MVLLTSEEEQEFYRRANSKRFRDMNPAQIVAILASEGTYFASESTLYRILRKQKALEHRQHSKKPRATRPAHNCGKIFVRQNTASDPLLVKTSD
jgi:putative transposase